MERAVISQKEYLKKYLSGDVDDKKKKKKKKRQKVGMKTVKVIDDDIDLKNMRPIDDNEFDILMDTEDAPQIAGIVDERGPVDFGDKRRWRIIADDGDGDITITSNDRGSKVQPDTKQIENSHNNTNKDSGVPVRNSDSDLSPPRRPNKYADDDLSPPQVSKSVTKKHKSKEVNDSDLSPPRRGKSGKHKRSKRSRKISRSNSDADGNSDSDVSKHKAKKTKASTKERTHDSDLSPRRRQKKSDSDLSPPRRRKNSDSDLSPPRRRKDSVAALRQRRRKINSDSDLSPPSRNKNSASDLSPRRRKISSDSDLSPPRRKINSDSDLSPPRKSKNHKDSNGNGNGKDAKQILFDELLARQLARELARQSKYDNPIPGPSHRISQDDDSDLSPPRKSWKEYDRNPSPPRREKSNDKGPANYGKWSKSNFVRTGSSKRNTMNSDSDLSPPRRSKDKYRNSSDSDLSPPRRVKVESDSDLSPPRKPKHYQNARSSARGDERSQMHSGKSSSKSSRNHYDSDSNSSRRKKQDAGRSSSSHNKYRDRDRVSPDRSKSGHKHDSKYNSGKDNSRNRDKPHRNSENKRAELKHMDSPEHNDKRMKKTLDGKTAGLQDAKALREETEAHKKREAEHFKKLSKEVSGVGQAAVVRDTKTGRKRNLEAEAAEEREKQKRQDELNEKYAKWGRGLKQVENSVEKFKDDLYEMSKPLARYADDADLDKQLRDQDREGDPMLDYIKQKQIKEGTRKPDRPSYEGSFMPNRFAIKPGHRWDGVDRSTGYEKKWLEAQSAKVARQEEAYKWSTSDM